MACLYNEYNVSLFDKLINHQYNGKTLNWLLLQPWWWFFICFSWWWYLTLNSLSPGCFPSENVKLFRGNEILKDPERSVLKFLKSGSKVESWTPLNRSTGQLWGSRQKSFHIKFETDISRCHHCHRGHHHRHDRHHAHHNDQNYL